ncbi:MAG TPA: tetratricopeptide repeat protein [Candidatus Polarisedimenticolaceae bacterium]|nr:tetratricopeptide repeat protein [Candidatus Polarisedimenticolaceae bacterium]
MEPDDPTVELKTTQIVTSSVTPGQVAHYRILQKVGEGGMGEVYLAEQEKPVRRRVALKLIKWGMDTKGVVARFESERQALALMNHPSIARVFDAGATAEGRPYFAMEYVKGLPILEYCDSERVGIVDRLELFMQICEGVQHAHQKGVIHRDIKPSNILVTIQDDRRVPKIIDFGVAKATEHRLTEQSMFTELGQLIGTPEYMSPEQAEMSSLDIDTRSDVYSLGVVLYELLTGALPFDSATLRAAGLWEIRRRIREVEPPRPSARLHALGKEAETVAKQRRSDPAALYRQVHGDLDWITMKALEKDRVRRYGSAFEFAADVARHLKHEPVLACPPSTIYRMRKFIKRHRAGVIAGTLVVAAMIAGTALAMVGMLRAVTAETQARKEATTAKEVSKFLEGVFEVADINDPRNKDIRARELLDKGAKKIESELQEQPLIQARLMGTIGRVYQRMGLFEEAERLLVAALDIRRKEVEGDRSELVRSLNDLGWLRQFQVRNDKAKPLHEEALAIAERFPGPSELDLAWSLYYLGCMHSRDGEYDAARPLLERAMPIFRKNPSADNEGLSWCLNDLSVTYVYSDEYARAMPLLEEALEIKKKQLGPEHADVARTLTVMGYNLTLAGEYGRAQQLLDQASGIIDKTVGKESLLMANALHSEGELQRLSGHLAAARPLLERALAIQLNLAPRDPDTALTFDSLAALEEREGHPGEAESLYHRALAVLPPSHQLRVKTVAAYAGLLRRLGRNAEAEVLLTGAPDEKVR